MGSNDRAYIYGHMNGDAYVIPVEPGDHDMRSAPVPATIKTHWDPRVEVSAPGGLGVQIGVVPPSEESTEGEGVWNTGDGQFLTLDRNGINRLIRALREARIKVYGEDE